MYPPSNSHIQIDPHAIVPFVSVSPDPPSSTEDDAATDADETELGAALDAEDDAIDDLWLAIDDALLPFKPRVVNPK